MYYTYAHTKPDGTIFYIGKGQGRRAWSKDNRNRHWKNVVAKYRNFTVEVLANWNTEEEAHSHEILLISCFKDMGYNLANVTNGGEGCSGYKHTEEHKKYISELAPSKRPEVAAKISAALAGVPKPQLRGEGNGMFGRTRTEEELKTISEQTRIKMAEQGFTHKITVCGKEFNSKRELARFVGVSHKTIQTTFRATFSQSLPTLTRLLRRQLHKCL